MTTRMNNWIDRLANAGVVPSDPEEERLRKALLTLSACFIAFMSIFWVSVYAALGLWLSAAIPFLYQVVSMAALYRFIRTKRFVFFRSSQLTMMLVLPCLLQWSLGGFVVSSGVILWSLTSPLCAMLFHGIRQSFRWFGAYLILIVISFMLDGYLSQYAPHISPSIVLLFLMMNIAAVSSVVYLLVRYFARRREEALAALDKEHKLLQIEQDRSERLLLNVLPAPIANRLKENPKVIADRLDEVTVLFADIAGFTPLSERVPPHEMVLWLNELFTSFDELVQNRGLEKIRTIGDSYMVVGGAPTPRPDHAEAIAELALEMLDVVSKTRTPSGEPLNVRIGINTGPAVSAVVGTHKFIYDVYGDSVNTASRMESQGLPGCIQVTEATYRRLDGRYRFEKRGIMQVKGKGEMVTYLLLGRKVEVEEPAPIEMAVVDDRR